MEWEEEMGSARNSKKILDGVRVFALSSSMGTKSCNKTQSCLLIVDSTFTGQNGHYFTKTITMSVTPPIVKPGIMRKIRAT